VVQIHESDARTTLDATCALLRERAVENNVLLQILSDQAGQASFGRYWWATEGDAVVGVAVHFPPRARALLSPMGRDTAIAVAESIVAPLPGVTAESTTAAAFAGSWAIRHQVAARPVDAQLLYQYSTLRGEAVEAPGVLTRAGPVHRQLLVRWFSASGTAHSGVDARRLVERALAEGEVWLWEDHGPVAMAVASKAVGGVSRVHAVFTPTEHRRCGYGTALVCGLSRHLVGTGLTCTLQTRLTNPPAHVMYRRIGYERVGEILAFRWDQ
jgi:predicted GNAT family acetyltransferase